MKPDGVVGRACKSLSMSDREIAKELDLSMAALRSLDGERCPRYLRLALAALIARVDADRILSAELPRTAVEPARSLQLIVSLHKPRKGNQV